MSEQTANLCTTDACESLRARLAKYEDAEGRPLSALVLPERKPVEPLDFNQTTADVEAIAHNACLDEVAHLNSSPVSAGVVPKLKAPRAIVKPCNYDGLSHWTHTQSSLVYSTEGEAKAAALADDAEYAAYIYSLLDTQPASAGDDDEPFRCEHAACKSLGEHHPFCEYVTQVSAGVVDERAAFEAAYLEITGNKVGSFDALEADYVSDLLQRQFLMFKAGASWQARAALTASAPNHGEQVRETWPHYVKTSESAPAAFVAQQMESGVTYVNIYGKPIGCGVAGGVLFINEQEVRSGALVPEGATFKAVRHHPSGNFSARFDKPYKAPSAGSHGGDV